MEVFETELDQSGPRVRITEARKCSRHNIDNAKRSEEKQADVVGNKAFFLDFKSFGLRAIYCLMLLIFCGDVKFIVDVCNASVFSDVIVKK